jgi:hypothetical protein
MNYLPYAGFWFYGATSKSERAAYYASWGLLAVAGTPAAFTAKIKRGLLMGVYP